MKKRTQGITLVETLVVCAIIAILLAMLLPAVMKVRTASDLVSCTNNLRNIGLALQMYHANHKSLPPGCGSPTDKYPFQAWSARLLPYLDNDLLWRESQDAFNQSDSFLTPHHEAVRRKTVRQLLCPADSRTVCPIWPNMGLLAYLGVAGTDQHQHDGLFYMDSKLTFGSISDGLANTIAVGERPPAGHRSEFGWWYAGWGQNKNGSADMFLGVRELNTCSTTFGKGCQPGPYHFMPGDTDNVCDAFHFWSQHPRGANFLFANGTVRFLTYDADSILPALATREGKETVFLD